MATTSEQVALALDYVQGKRRTERVLQAADALLDRYGDESDPQRRVHLAYELIRRNFAENVTVEYDGTEYRSGTDEPAGGELRYTARLTGPNGEPGTLSAGYTPPGSLGLTGPEWLAAMRLFSRIAALGTGGRAICP
ncbi:hypothetical protein [Streptomyces sp. NPDC002088]|uniref:hypothetical protein n=1 Tax=unclassified Streptomyces TaxID=2593676 RepID=UPI0033277E99